MAVIAALSFAAAALSLQRDAKAAKAIATEGRAPSALSRTLYLGGLCGAWSAGWCFASVGWYVKGSASNPPAELTKDWQDADFYRFRLSNVAYSSCIAMLVVPLVLCVVLPRCVKRCGGADSAAEQEYELHPTSAKEGAERTAEFRDTSCAIQGP